MTRGFRCYEVLRLSDHGGGWKFVSLQPAQGKQSWARKALRQRDTKHGLVPAQGAGPTGRANATASSGLE